MTAGKSKEGWSVVLNRKAVPKRVSNARTGVDPKTSCGSKCKRGRFQSTMPGTPNSRYGGESLRGNG